MSVVEAAERTLPHNLEAECSVLGVILVHNDAWSKAAGSLTGEDFYRDAHRRIWDAMQALTDRNVRIDFITLKEQLRTTGELEEVGGPAYISALADGTPKETNIEFYAQIVKEKATLRNTIYVANRILSNAYEEEQTAAEIIEDGVGKILELARPADTVVTVAEAMKEWYALFDAEKKTGVDTGYADLDEHLGGLQPQRVIMIAGRPGSGKSTALMNILENIAATKTPVALFSLEMGRNELIEQSISRLAQIDSHRLKTRTLGQKDYGRISHALEQLNDMPFYIKENATTFTQIQAWSRRLKQEHNVSIFGIDYIQLISGSNVRDRRHEIDYISRGLVHMAKDLNATFLVLSQLTRASEQRSDHRPHLSDLKESGQLEADAHSVILIYREDMHNTDPNHPDAGTAEFIVAKNRGGPTGTVRLAFLKEQGRFANLALA